METEMEPEVTTAPLAPFAPLREGDKKFTGTATLAPEERSALGRKGAAATNAKRRGVARRGFASMPPEKRRAIASKGGKAAHRKGTGHEFTPDEARAAGALGGRKVSEGKAGREHMKQIGILGGRKGKGRRRGVTPATEARPGRGPEYTYGEM